MNSLTHYPRPPSVTPLFPNPPSVLPCDCERDPMAGDYDPQDIFVQARSDLERTPPIESWWRSIAAGIGLVLILAACVFLATVGQP